MSPMFIAGLVLLAASAVFGARTRRADRDLRQHRHPDATRSAFDIVALRNRHSLYVPAGHRLVDRFWRLLIVTYALALAGGLLVVLGWK